MPESARRSGLDALRGVLRRRNPGFDVVFGEVEGADLVDDPAPGEIVGSLTTPEDAGAVGSRIDVDAAAPRLPDEQAVDEAGENLAAIVSGEG